MTLRVLTADDAAIYRTMRLEALQAHPKAFGSSYSTELARPLSVFAERLEGSTPGSFALGAFDEDVLVGFLGFHRESSPKAQHKGWIWGVYVATTHKRKGIGRALFEKALSQIRATEGIAQVSLDVGTYNVGARHLYASVGFVGCGIEPRALKVDGEFIDEERMVLLID